MIKAGISSLEVEKYGSVHDNSKKEENQSQEVRNFIGSIQRGKRYLYNQSQHVRYLQKEVQYRHIVYWSRSTMSEKEV